MTLNQLLREVYSLGFEENGEIDESFLFCAKRAQRLIFLELAAESVASFIVPKNNLSCYLGSYTHTPGEICEIPIKGKAYSFKFTGNGEYAITDNNGTQYRSFGDSKGAAYGFINGDGKIIFSGEYSYSILDFAVFESLAYSSISKIPIISEIMEYDLTSHIKDIMAITKPPHDKYGNAIPNASIEGDRLRVPKDFYGETFIHYKRSPEALFIDDAEQKVDIPPFCEHLLPILTASYLWLDDDAEKADYYMGIYRDEANRIKVNLPRSHSNLYLDTTGWAP